MKKIRIVTCYDSYQNKAENRYKALASCNKLNSIIRVLQSLGYSIEIISMSWTLGQRDVKGKKYYDENGVEIKLFYSFGRSCLIKRLLNFIAMRVQLFFYMLKNITSQDVVIVYHSMVYLSVVKLIKQIKKFPMILEMEEIYADVTGHSKWRKKELQLADMADAYIFPTQLLNESTNKKSKPSVVIHGTYQTEKDRKTKFKDDKIHVVYAGTLDPRKGSIAVVEAAEYLQPQYHIHIIGFGTVEEIKNLKHIIAEKQAEKTAKVSYDGVLSGEEYIKFIQSCDIGLSPQDPDAPFNSSSFPSKILSYLSNGLHVVSIRIPAIEKSAVSDLLTYYDEQTPSKIAEAIQSVNMSYPYDSRQRLDELNCAFSDKLNKIVEDFISEN